DVVLYVCTSGTIAIGPEKISASVKEHLPNAALTSPMIGALAAFKALDIKATSFLTPYPDEINMIMANCIEDHGVEVVDKGSFHLDDDRDIAKVTPEAIFQAALSMDDPSTQSIFIPCTGLRTSTIISPLEERLGKPVITAHQAMFWHGLRLAGYQTPIKGYGQLMEK
ncbi:MAG: hypothetical protein AAF603_05105, partial [Pseudomonadota bacterium]